MTRGEVWWVDFGPPVGRRPAVLMSRARAYQVRSAVTMIPLTRTIRGIPTEVILGPADGVPHPSVANADTITTVPLVRVQTYPCTLAAGKIEDIERAIKFALDMP